MTEAVEIMPRFLDPDAPRKEEPLIPSLRSPPVTQPIGEHGSISKGILTSIYDNKLLVLIVVIVIIIIAVIAYIVFRKPDAEVTPKNRIKGGTAQATGTTQATPTGTTQATQQPAATQATPTGTAQANSTAPEQQPATPAPEPADRTSLSALLDRSRNMNTPPAQQSVVNTNSKSEDEIMQLMEYVDTADTADDNVSQDDDVQPTKQPEEVVVDNLCTHIVPPGRRCRNPARTNGKCTRHAG